MTVRPGQVATAISSITVTCRSLVPNGIAAQMISWRMEIVHHSAEHVKDVATRTDGDNNGGAPGVGGWERRHRVTRLGEALSR